MALLALRFRPQSTPSPWSRVRLREGGSGGQKKKKHCQTQPPARFPVPAGAALAAAPLGGMALQQRCNGSRASSEQRPGPFGPFPCAAASCMAPAATRSPASCSGMGPVSVAMCGVIWDQPGAGNRRGRRCLARESEDSARGMLKLSHESRPGKIFVTLSWQRAQPRGTRALSCAPRAGCTHGGWHEGDPVLFPVPAPHTEGFSPSPSQGSLPTCGGPRLWGSPVPQHGDGQQLAPGGGGTESCREGYY